MLLLLLFSIAFWSSMNQLFVNAVTNYTRDKVGDQELEVLHALFSEVPAGALAAV